MSKPFILALDDDTNVLRAVERDLRKKFQSDYRIVRADSGAAALELLHELKRRDDPAALFLVDQRMPNMTGVDFLARNSIPYLYLDPEVNEDARQLLETSEMAKPELPALFFPDGSVLQKPENREIADRVGLRTSADKPFYDLIVVGAGPAGLAAAVYGASEGLKTLVVEKHAPGGQAGMSSRIENYLGFPGGLSGGELARRAVNQAQRFGVEILTAQEIVGLAAKGPTRTVKLGDGSELCCRALVIATGVSWRRLHAKGVEHLTGAGVYYGAAG